MSVIEPLFNNDMALQSMNDVNQLFQNEDVWHHHIIIFVRAVNDAAP